MFEQNVCYKLVTSVDTMASYKRMGISVTVLGLWVEFFVETAIIRLNPVLYTELVFTQGSSLSPSQQSARWHDFALVTALSASSPCTSFCRASHVFNHQPLFVVSWPWSILTFLLSLRNSYSSLELRSASVSSVNSMLIAERRDSLV